MHEAQQYFGTLLEEPLAENADLCLTVAEELLQLQHAEEVWELSCEGNVRECCFCRGAHCASSLPCYPSYLLCLWSMLVLLHTLQPESLL